MTRRPLFEPWLTLSGMVAIDIGRGPEPYLATVHDPLVAEHHARQRGRHRLGPEVPREDVMRAQLLAEMEAEGGGARRPKARDV